MARVGRATTFLAVAFAMPVAIVTSATCGSSNEGSLLPSGAGGAGGGSSMSSANGGGFSFGGNTSAGGSEACAQTNSQADLTDKPVDIIFVVGNNGSLAQEIAAVEDNINASFAQIIGASGIDYRVIMISRSGSHQFNLCVEAPLGGVPAGGCANEPLNAPPVNNPPYFFHYSVNIFSDDAWCKMLGSFDGSIPDEYGQQPAGWSAWLRPEAGKVFVMITDSGMNCLHQNVDLDDGPQQPSMSDIPQAQQAAADLDNFLLTMSPTHFGTVSERNYTWHSIVGLEANDPLVPTDPWLPSDPLSLVKCTGNGTNPVSPALGNQQVSITSEGLRFPICQYPNFDVVFQTIAQGVVAGALLKCEFPVPDPPPGETLDLTTVQVQFTPTNGTTETFDQVAGVADCMPDKFYIEADTIKLCPDTCTKVQSDTSAELNILYGCELNAN